MRVVFRRWEDDGSVGRRQRPLQMVINTLVNLKVTCPMGRGNTN